MDTFVTLVIENQGGQSKGKGSQEGKERIITKV